MTTKTKTLTLFDNVPQDLTNLKMGAPGEYLLKQCTEIMKKAVVHSMDQPNSYLLFQYGPEAGDRKFLQTLADFLCKEYLLPVDVEDLVATSGATHGLCLILQLLTSLGDLVFVEDPTYFAALKIVQSDSNLEVAAVSTDEFGIIPEELEKAIVARLSHKPRELTEKKPFWSILYLLSTFHNPTGVCLPPDRCKKVIEIARKYNILVVCDDVYNLLYFNTKPNRLFTFDNKSDPDYKGNVISNCSFSKIFGPGMRLGWMEVPQRVKKIIVGSGIALSSGGFNHHASGLMTSVISQGFLGNMLLEARKNYQGQSEAASKVLREQLPSATFMEPQGGYFMWIKLPNGLSGVDVLKRCEDKYKVTFFPGHFASPTGKFKNYIRISFSTYPKEDMASASEKIVLAVKELLENK